ncbi:hypothetical protein C8Q70DRAFT_169835 [Cubamyces menziesii]|nr:hypothetical protein C8Q70DRAFT_169835 [Cubamyces menziesii]
MHVPSSVYSDSCIIRRLFASDDFHCNSPGAWTEDNQETAHFFDRLTGGLGRVKVSPCIVIFCESPTLYAPLGTISWHPKTRPHSGLLRPHRDRGGILSHAHKGRFHVLKQLRDPLRLRRAQCVCTHVSLFRESGRNVQGPRIIAHLARAGGTFPTAVWAESCVCDRRKARLSPFSPIRRPQRPNKFYYRTEKADPTLHFGRRRTASHLNAAAAAKRDKCVAHILLHKRFIRSHYETGDGRKTHMNGAVSNGRDAIGRPYRTHLIQTVSKALMRKSFEIVVSDPDMRAWYFQGCDCRNDNGG